MIIIPWTKNICAIFIKEWFLISKIFFYCYYFRGWWHWKKKKPNVFFPCLLFSYILEESRYKKGNTQKTFFIKRLHEEAMHLYMRPYTPLNAPLLDWISKCCFSLSVVISYDLAESRYQRKAKKPDFIKRQDQKVERAYIWDPICYFKLKYAQLIICEQNCVFQSGVFSLWLARLLLCSFLLIKQPTVTTSGSPWSPPPFVNSLKCKQGKKNNNPH